GGRVGRDGAAKSAAIHGGERRPGLILEDFFPSRTAILSLSGKRTRGDASAAPATSSALKHSLREWIRSKLEVHGHRFHTLAAFDQPRRAIAARGPQAAPLPAGIRVVDAAVESLGVAAERIGHPQREHLALLE